jgi:PIN domain nuclease of toxin-antitoxin system
MNGYLLDTHVWFWLLGATEKTLDATSRELLETASQQRRLFLSAISVWEAAQKARGNKPPITVRVEDLLAASVDDGSIQLLPLSVEVLIGSHRLPGEIHGDPADRMLVATARLQGLTLVTHDTGLRQYAKQGHMKVHKV